MVQRFLLLSAPLFLVATPTGAQAAEPESAEQSEPSDPGSSTSANERALSLGHRALGLFQKEQYAGAILLFEEAERLAHSPVFLFYQAEAHYLQDNLLRAHELFVLCAAERLSGDAPTAWSSAVDRAKTRVLLLEQLMPRLKLAFLGQVEFPVVVELNGQRVALVGSGELTLVRDPGRYAIRVVDAADRVQRRTFSAKAGAPAVQIDFFFPAFVSTRGSAEPSASTRKVSFKDVLRTDRQAMRRGAYVSLGIGAGAAVFGGAALGAAFAIAGGIKRRCGDSVCPEDEFGTAQTATTWANLASVGFTVGIAGGVTGVTLLFLSRQGPSRSRALLLQPTYNGLRLRGRF